MDKIQNFLLNIGVKTTLKGFDYLHDAISLVMEDEKLKSETIQLYHKVAEINNETPSKVERCIRTAKDSCFNKSNYDKICSVFGEGIAKAGRIKSGEFIVTSYLHLK